MFTKPEKWRVELRAKTGHYRNRCLARAYECENNVLTCQTIFNVIIIEEDMMSHENKVSWTNLERWLRKNKVKRIISVLQYSIYFSHVQTWNFSCILLDTVLQFHGFLQSWFTHCLATGNVTQLKVCTVGNKVLSLGTHIEPRLCHILSASIAYFSVIADFSRFTSPFWSMEEKIPTNWMPINRPYTRLASQIFP